MLPKEIASDLLIVGGGVAAMSAGMEAAKLGLKVVVADKGRVGSAVRRPRPVGTLSFPFRKSREVHRETGRKYWPGTLPPAVMGSAIRQPCISLSARG
jgi:flavin-dependent dehydrogenase